MRNFTETSMDIAAEQALVMPAGRTERRASVDKRPAAPTAEQRLAARIASQVRRRTARGVSDLEVRVTSTGVVLRGRCDTFYQKQLAQHAAMRLSPAGALVNEIEVR